MSRLNFIRILCSIDPITYHNSAKSNLNISLRASFLVELFVLLLFVCRVVKAYVCQGHRKTPMRKYLTFTCLITPVSVASKTFLISNEEIYCPIFHWKSDFTAP